MRSNTSRQTAALIGLWVLAMAAISRAESSLESLLARLSEGPLDRAVLWQIEGHMPDARTIPALRKEFEKREVKQERQWIAATLLRLGEKSDRYFEFLSSYAKQAIDDRTPFFEKVDAQGRSIRGEFSAEFENWCALNHKDPRAVAAVELGTYPIDVVILAETEDPRANGLFRRGLESPNPGVVAYCAQGLARLQDLSALPLIAAAAERFAPGDRTAVAKQLPWYSRQEAEQLFARLVPIDSYRQHYRGEVQIAKSLELKRVLSRNGTAAEK